MSTQNNQPVNEQHTEQIERSEQTLVPATEKRPFVEPVVSFPLDVLEATTFFQTGTVEGTTV